MTQREDPRTDPLAAAEAPLRRLFDRWRSPACRRASPAAGKELAEAICAEVAIHLRLQEELVYPLAQDSGGAWVAVATDHGLARDLMRQVLLCREGPALVSRVDRLCSFFEQHLGREAPLLLARLHRCGADLAALGRRMRERRRELEAVPEALREEALASAGA